MAAKDRQAVGSAWGDQFLTAELVTKNRQNTGLKNRECIRTKREYSEVAKSGLVVRQASGIWASNAHNMP